ncbi:MAG TPA: hypothetical protein VM533_02790 [Fimbriiglobus sp.]|jgi:hypothetical protein|nr:hypothetical protein [Fimbriiglobus sp.]
MLTVDARAIGRRQPLLSDWSVPLPPDVGPDGGQTTLRKLIDRIVRAEVHAFQSRQEERKLFRALTAREIAEAAAKGKVAAGLHEEATPQTVNPDEAVGVALQAFEDGLYLVIVDDEEQKDLDRELFLKPDSRVTFVRLTMLAGG